MADDKVRMTKTGVTAAYWAEPDTVTYWVARGWAVDPTAATPLPPGSQPVTHDELAAVTLVETAVKSAAYTAAAGDLVPVDTTAAARTVTLPAATAGRRVGVRREAGANTLTIAAAGTDKIGSGTATSMTVAATVGETVVLQAPPAGGRWQVVGGYTASGGMSAFVPNTVALLGDSITGQNSEANGESPYHDAKGFWTWANILLGQRFTLVGPAGAALGEFGGSGLTTEQFISGGHVAAAAASSAAWVVVNGGTNDLAASTAAEIAARHLAIWRTLTAAGKRVVATTITPRDNADATATLDKVRDTNRLIRANARVEPGVVLCDWYPYLVDTATGKADLNYYYDGIHPDAAGASRMGRALADVLDGLTAPDDSWSPMDTADTKSILPNPFMIGDTSGGATSATFTTVGAGVYSKSKVARTDGIPGEWQQLQVTTAAANGDGVQLQQQNTAVGVDWAVGDTVYAVAEVETDAAAWAGKSLSLVLSFFGNGAAAIGNRITSAESTALTAALLRPERGVLRTPSAVVPTGTTRLQLNANFTGLGTVRVGRFDIVKVN